MKKTILIIALLFNLIPFIKTGKVEFLGMQAAYAQDWSTETTKHNDHDGNGDYCTHTSTTSGDEAGVYSVTVCVEEVDCDSPTSIILDDSGNPIDDCTTTTFPDYYAGDPGAPPSDTGSGDGTPPEPYTGPSAVPPPNGGIILSPPTTSFGCTGWTIALNHHDADSFFHDLNGALPIAQYFQSIGSGPIGPIVGALQAAQSRSLNDLEYKFDQQSLGLVITFLSCTSTNGSSSTYIFSLQNGAQLGLLTF